MRIHVRIAVARKMFAACQNLIILHALHIRQSAAHHTKFIIAKGTVIYHRIIRIAVHIYIRCKIDMNTDAFHLSRNFFSHIINQTGIVNCTQRQLPWIGNGIIQSHTQTPFSIKANPQWCFTLSLIAICQFCLLLWCSLKENQATYFIFINVFVNGFIAGFIFIRIGSHHE